MLNVQVVQKLYFWGVCLQNMTVKQREKYEEAKRLKEEEEERNARRAAQQVNLMRPRTAAELRNR